MSSEAVPPDGKLDGLDESSTEFLLAEYELVAQMRWHLVDAFQTGLGRVLGLNTAAFGALVFFAATDGRPLQDIALAVSVVGIALSVINHNLARRAVAFQISTRRYLRALNQLRGFFVSRDPSIGHAIALPTDP